MHPRGFGWAKRQDRHGVTAVGELALSLCGPWCARTQETRGPVPPPAPGTLPRVFWEMATGLPLGTDVPWLSSLCCRCCSSSLRGRAGPCTPPRRGRAPSGTTTSAARWRLAREGPSARPGLGSPRGGDGLGVPWDTRPHTAQPAGPGPVWVRPCRSRILWGWTVWGLCHWAGSARLCLS